MPIPTNLPKYVFFAIPECNTIFSIKRGVGLWRTYEQDSPASAESIAQAMNRINSIEWGMTITDKVVGCMMQTYTPWVWMRFSSGIKSLDR